MMTKRGPAHADAGSRRDNFRVQRVAGATTALVSRSAISQLPVFFGWSRPASAGMMGQRADAAPRVGGAHGEDQASPAGTHATPVDTSATPVPMPGLEKPSESEAEYAFNASHASPAALCAVED